MRIIIDISPNQSKKKRSIKDIKTIIIHYTGMQSEIESLKRLKNSKSKVSCHYLINRKGLIKQLVKDHKIAWHAGKSKWKNQKDLNKTSIGIELENKGHKNGYQNFTKIQINRLIILCKKLKKKYKIKNENFLGHSDIAPLRKIDPGEKFPWKKLSNYKLGNWYKKKQFNFVSNKKKEMRNQFFLNLYIIGYRYFSLYKSNQADRSIIRAFQQRYNPRKATGKIDKKTLVISHFLANP